MTLSATDINLLLVCRWQPTFCFFHSSQCHKQLTQPVANLFELLSKAENIIPKKCVDRVVLAIEDCHPARN